MSHLKRVGIEKLFISEQASIRDAMTIIDEGLCKIAFVVDERKYLKGVIADPDIRRALLKGYTLDSPSHEIMNKSPISIPDGLSKKQARQLVKHHKRDILPILDEKGCVVDAILLVESLESKTFSNEVILMAGGKGKRLLPLTRETPKPMLEVGKKPILELLLESLLSNGFSNFRISLNYLGEHIQKYFGDGSRWGASISYVTENTPLGTAGALSLLNRKPIEPFIIVNCDVLTKIDFELLLEHHNKSESYATMCVTQQEISVPYGVVEHNNFSFKNMLEKPVYNYLINAGIYVLSPEVLPLLEKNTYMDMTSLIDKIHLQMGNVTLFPIREYWLDIGTHRTLEQAKQDYPIQF